MSFKNLEKLFIELLKTKQTYTQIGSYWERGNKNEIDIVAIDDIEKTITFCEVKLSAKKLDKNDLVSKSKKLLQKYSGYQVEYKLLSIDNIQTELLN